VSILEKDVLIHARQWISNWQQYASIQLHDNFPFLRHDNDEGAVCPRALAIMRRWIFLCSLLVFIAIFTGQLFGTDPIMDPFTAFVEYMPGNARPTDGWRCEDEYAYPQTPPYFYCARSLDDSVVRWVSVSGTNGVIARTSFGVNLRYGDLVGLFGRARSVSGTRYLMTVRWSGMQAYVRGRWDEMLPMTSTVKYVSFFIEQERNR
jgi:hypothetical protein